MTIRERRIKRIYSNVRFQEILAIEPRIAAILDRAKRIRLSRDYHWYPTYVDYKHELMKLVGWEAERDELRSEHDYDLVIGAVDTILPLDCDELFPDGGSPSDPNHPCYCDEAEYYRDMDEDDRYDDHDNHDDD